MNSEKTNKIMSTDELDNVLPKYESVKLSGKNLAQNYVSAFNTGMNIYQCINQLQGSIVGTIHSVNNVVKSWNDSVDETLNKSIEITEEKTTEQFNKEWTNKQPELVEQVNKLTTNQFNNEKSVFNDELKTLDARMNTFTKLAEGSTTADAELTDIRVGANGITYDTAGNAVRGQYRQLNEDLDNLREIEFYPNLLNKAEFIAGKQMAISIGSTPDDLVDNENTTTTNIINCDGDEYFETNLPSGSTVILAYFWYQEKWYRSQFISTLETEGDHYKFKINAQMKKIRIYCTSKMMPANPILTKQGEYDESKPEFFPKGKIKLTPSSCVRYDNLDDILKTKINSIPSPTVNNSILVGKKIVGIGDSIMIGVGSGAIGSGGFLDVLKDYEKNVTVVNMGVGSTTIQKNDNVPTNLTGKCILDRLNDIPNDADIIILEGGINDYYHQEKYGTTLGTYEENRYKYPLGAKYENGEYSLIQYVGTDGILQDNNFCGAFELCLIKILVRFIGKPFIYVIPHNPVGIKDIDDYFDIAKIICKKYGVPCLDLREVACMPRINVLCGNADGTSIYTVDNVHPSRKGYEVHYAPLIYNFLKTIIV